MRVGQLLVLNEVEKDGGELPIAWKSIAHGLEQEVQVIDLLDL